MMKYVRYLFSRQLDITDLGLPDSDGCRRKTCETHSKIQKKKKNL